MSPVHDMSLIIPEVWLAIAGMALLMMGVFFRRHVFSVVYSCSIGTLVVAGVLIYLTGTQPGLPVGVFGELLTVDSLATFAKTLVLVGAILTLVMASGFMRRYGMNRFELPVLMVFATLGMFVMISANDLMTMYVGLEMQSLALYVCAAFQRDKSRSSEAGLKYFVLGAVASGMLLYGCSLVYGFAGTTTFSGIAESGSTLSTGVLVGMVFILAGLAFKISAVPFHMWTPDVYEGAPTPVTAFLSLAPKVAAVALLLRVLADPFAGYFEHWQQIVFLLAVASMVLGALGAIGQQSIKRLLAYSSIGHMGFALVGLAAGTADGYQGMLVYMAIYVVMGLGTWGCVLAMRRNGLMIEKIADLGGLSRNSPQLALCLAVFMFSMAGIPPLAGFFGKFYVFMAAINAGLYTLAVVGVLASVVGAFYYLRIVKIMYFDAPCDPFDRPMGRELWPVVGITAIVTLAMFLNLDPLLDYTGFAVQDLI